MKKYDNYKDSGIEWIGEIPEHWRIDKFNRIFQINTGFTPSTGNNEFYENGEHDWITIRDLNGKFVSESKTKLTDIAVKGKTKIPEGALLYSFKLSVGQMAFTTKDLYTNEAIFSVFPCEGLNLNYYYYLLDRILVHNSNENIYGAKILNQELIKASKLLVPSEREQTSIANYLDYKTAQIDTLIAKKEQFISLLQEERTAVINQAVTKGLDLNSEMIPLNIQGLEEIPKRWKLMKFKWFAPILTCGVASTPEYVDESIGMPFLSAQNVKNNKMRLDKYRFISIDLHETLTKNRKPQNGDILVTRVGAGIGDACIVDCDFEFSVYVSLTHIRVVESIVNNKFIMYFFNTDYCKYLNSQGTVTGGGVGNLNVNNVERYKVPIPPLNEQVKIVEFIENKTTEIDKIISKTEQEIELLKEYKTALISEVVTGKVDVRDVGLN